MWRGQRAVTGTRDPSPHSLGMRVPAGRPRGRGRQCLEAAPGSKWALPTPSPGQDGRSACKGATVIQDGHRLGRGLGRTGLWEPGGHAPSSMPPHLPGSPQSPLGLGDAVGAKPQAGLSEQAGRPQAWGRTRAACSAPSSPCGPIAAAKTAAQLRVQPVGSRGPAEGRLTRGLLSGALALHRRSHVRGVPGLLSPTATPSLSSHRFIPHRSGGQEPDVSHREARVRALEAALLTAVLSALKTFASVCSFRRRLPCWARAPSPTGAFSVISLTHFGRFLTALTVSLLPPFTRTLRQQGGPTGSGRAIPHFRMLHSIVPATSFGPRHRF